MKRKVKQVRSNRYTSKRTVKTGRKKTPGYFIKPSFVDVLEELFGEPKLKKSKKR